MPNLDIEQHPLHDEIRRHVLAYCKPGAWGFLKRAYSGHDRHYHGWNHIVPFLDLIDEFEARIGIVNPRAMRQAALWHDAFYFTQNPDGSLRPDRLNVQSSADAFQFYTRLNPREIAPIHDMIMDTANHKGVNVKEKKHYEGFENDRAMFLDFDLSSFALPWDKFSALTGDVRQEFHWVADDMFRKGRADVFRKFMPSAGTRIYYHEELEKLWGDKARANIARAIRELDPAGPQIA